MDIQFDFSGLSDDEEQPMTARSRRRQRVKARKFSKVPVKNGRLFHTGRFFYIDGVRHEFTVPERIWSDETRARYEAGEGRGE